MSDELELWGTGWATKLPIRFRHGAATKRYRCLHRRLPLSALEVSACFSSAVLACVLILIPGALLSHVIRICHQLSVWHDRCLVCCV